MSENITRSFSLPHLFLFYLVLTTGIWVNKSSAFDLTDLIYQGSFNVPAGQIGPTPVDTFSYGGTALGFDPTDGGLYIAGHDLLCNGSQCWGQRVSKISIPNPVNSTQVGSLPTATLILPFKDASGLPNTPSSHILHGGFLPFGNKVIGNWYVYYDNDWTKVSHFTADHNMTNLQGLYALDSPTGAGMVAGYMALVPPGLQFYIGAPAVTGMMGLSVVGRTSFGAALFGFNPADLIGNPATTTVPTIPLVNYPEKEPPGETDGAFSYTGAFDPATNPFNHVSFIRGVFFHEQSKSAIFVGSQGIGEYCYKESCNPPTGGNSVIGNKYVNGIWIYSVTDFLSVRYKTKQPWELRPTGWFELKFPQSSSAGIGGVAVDPATNRVFISQTCATGDCLPIIHVYKLSGSTSTTNSPPAPPMNLRIN